MKLSKKILVRLAFLCILLYLLSYCYLLLIKGGVYGSDILHISNIVKKAGTFTPISALDGFPPGFVIILQAESELFHTDVLNFAKIHISLLFIAIFALVSLLAFTETKNRLISILAGFITISACPFATIMSPQYLQEVTLAAIILLSGFIFLSKYEKSKKPIFLIIGLFLTLFIIFIHRSTLVITFVTLSFWLTILLIKQKRSMTTVLMIISSLIIFILLVVGIYGEYIHRPLIVSNIIETPTDYTSSFFMNYVGWELVPFLIAAMIFFKDILKRFSTIFLSFAIVCILFSGIYLTGHSLISTTIAWRATYYMLFILSILTSYVIYALIKRKKYSLLFGISSISFLLFILDRPVQQYIYRVVSGTTPERISGVPFLFGKFAPYIILCVMVAVLLLAFLLFILLYYKKSRYSITRKSFVVIFIVALILLPRGLMSGTSFYLMPQNLTDKEEQLLIYLNRELPDEIVFSDPHTTNLVNKYGLKTWVPSTPLYGPFMKGLGMISGWARETDEIFRKYTAEQTYKFMRSRKISLLVINEESGRLVDYNVNGGKGGYVPASQIIKEFNEKIVNSTYFNKLFEYPTEKGRITIYDIGR